MKTQRQESITRDHIVGTYKMILLWHKIRVLVNDLSQVESNQEWPIAKMHWSYEVKRASKEGVTLQNKWLDVHYLMTLQLT
jgi:hypothetical protein